MEEPAVSLATGPVGQRVRKHDGDEFLAGRAVYTGDIVLPGMLHAALVRSPHAHARIVSIDAERARARPEVHAVLTGEQALELVGEVPHSLDPAAVGGNHAVIRVLAVGKVVFAGEPVVAVVADTEGDAAAAARDVEVIYEPLPHVLDGDEALADGAPLLYEDWGTNLIIAGEFGADDFDQAAAGCPHVLEGEVRGHRGNAAPMEPRAYVADWDQRRRHLTLYGTTQNPHPLRSTLATALGLPESDIQVISPRIGGSFGLKMYGSREDFLIAVLTRLVGRPVRWFEDRASALLPGTRDQVLRYRAAFSGDGRVHALEVDVVSDHGAVGNGHGWGMAFVGAMCIGTGYALEHCRVTYKVVATNKAPWGGTKPFGKDGATLVMERVLDRVARATSVDPAEVRRRNFLSPDAFPYVHTSGLELDSGNYHGALKLTLDRLDYTRVRAEQAQLAEQGRWLGIGIGFELMPENADVPGAFVAAFDTTTVRMNPSGQATVLTGVTTPGSGSDTGISQMVAQELGISLDDVTMVQGDTELCPFGYGNLSSRSIVTGGSSAVLAARDIAAKLRIVAAAMLEAAEAEQIVLAGGMATVAGEPERTLPIAAVAGAVFSLAYILALGIEPNLESTRTFRPTNIRQIPDELGRLNTYSTYPFAVHASVVELDPETGVLEVRRHVVTHDCGTMINPMLIDGQVVGGAVMGLGAALGEEFVYGADGVPLSVGFKTYLLARAADLPTIELEHQVTPTPVTVLGAKGVGEAGFSGAQAALLGAVNDALRPLGAQIDRTPVSPPNVLRAIHEASR
jgi:aerobic carbon-monoxide dehydrogenase large subunit